MLRLIQAKGMLTATLFRNLPAASLRMVPAPEPQSNETKRPVFVHILQLVNTRRRVLGLQGFGASGLRGACSAHGQNTRAP